MVLFKTSAHLVSCSIFILFKLYTFSHYPFEKKGQKSFPNTILEKKFKNDPMVA